MFLVPQTHPAHVSVCFVVILCMQHAQRLDDAVIHDRDYDYDYFGFKVSIKCDHLE